jgi:hypothetical protein
MPLAYLMIQAADSFTAAAYVAPSFHPVVAVSYMSRFFHALVDIATWVPFFDSGARVLVRVVITFLVDGIRSGGHHLPSAHLCIRPSSVRGSPSEPSGTLLVDFLDLILYVLVGGLGIIVERYLPKQAPGQSRSRALPQQMRHPSTQARFWYSSRTICEELRRSAKRHGDSFQMCVCLSL